jgi:uncharacterized protein (TIGR03437 family)
MQEGFVRTKALLSLFAGIPIVLLAFTATPSIRFAGAPFDDNGATCLACHQVSATLPGSVSLNITTYTPGVTQLIHVTINDPQGVRWGFQLTARSLNDRTQEAGTFTPVDPSVVTVRCDDGTATGSAAPCNGSREFAQHASAPDTAPGAGFTFDVNWTAPLQEVGNIVFYVAALAANADNKTTGDRTYTAMQLVPLDPAAACSNTKTPNLQKVSDAAAFGKNLASGGLWTINGFDFETSNLKRTAGPGDFVNNAFPNVLGCIAVEVNHKRVPITYVQTDQINFQGPVVSGPVDVVVVSNAGKQNELRSSAVNVTVLPAAPAFFTFNGSSIAAQFANTADIVANPAVVPGARPARPGDIVTLYGTGFGATDPPVAVGALATGVSRVTTTPVTVTIGGVTLASPDVFYAGLSPGSISGLYQLNVRIPPTSPDGDILVVVSVGGVPSQTGATIPVKSVQ